MRKYKNIKTNEIANVISMTAAGTCNKTMGMTLVLFKLDKYNEEVILVMENKEFNKLYKKEI